jgi:hypothetical protein
MLLRGTNTRRSEEEAGEEGRDEVVIDKPGVLRSRTDIVKAAALGPVQGLVHVKHESTLDGRDVVPNRQVLER